MIGKCCSRQAILRGHGKGECSRSSVNKKNRGEMEKFNEGRSFFHLFCLLQPVSIRIRHPGTCQYCYDCTAFQTSRKI